LGDALGDAAGDALRWAFKLVMLMSKVKQAR
jgi:hypothetical protein